MIQFVSSASIIGPGFEIGDRIELNTDANALRRGLLPLDPVLAGFLSQVAMDDDDETTALKFNALQGAFKSVKHLRPSPNNPGRSFSNA